MTVTNEGSGSLQIDQVSVLGQDAEAFAIAAGADACSNQGLEAGESCTVGVEFEPVAVGEAEAELFFPGDGAAGVSLAGTGSAPDPTEPTDPVDPSVPGQPSSPGPVSPPSQAAPAGVEIELPPSKRVRATPAGRVPLRVRCISPAGTPCATTLQLKPVGAGRAAQVSWRGAIAAGTARRIVLELRPTIRRLLAERGSLKLRAAATVRGGAGSAERFRVLTSDA